VSATEEAPALAEGVDTPTPSGKSSSLLIRSLKLWRTRIGVIFVLVLLAVAIFGPLVAPHASDEFIALPNSKPGQNGAGMFGTDYLGQDILSRFLDGGRSILWLSIVSTAIGLIIGVAIGLVAAYARNYIDDILMRTMDVIMAFPQIMLALVAVSLLGASNWLVIAAIALTTAPRVARVARGAAQPVVERDFIAATESMGLKRWRILNGEVLPNILGPMMVETTLRLTYSVTTVASLAYLGLAPDPNGANWGTDIQKNQAVLVTNPWGSLLPIIAIALLTMGTGLIGDGIARTAAGIDREREE
jgi:peptide/nickel transport system permease protein